METVQDPVTPPPAATWRFKVGVAIICLMLGSWLMVPLAEAVKELPASQRPAFNNGRVQIDLDQQLVITAAGQSQTKRATVRWPSRQAVSRRCRVTNSVSEQPWSCRKP